METARRQSRNDAIEVHEISDAERRLLLEMLASERCGEECLDVRDGRRGRTAEVLADLRMTWWIDSDAVVFTHYGRAVAESLALRLVHRRPRDTC
jgi:hypothetical protein